MQKKSRTGIYLALLACNDFSISREVKRENWKYGWMKVNAKREEKNKEEKRQEGTTGEGKRQCQQQRKIKQALRKEKKGERRIR